MGPCWIAKSQRPGRQVGDLVGAGACELMGGVGGLLDHLRCSTGVFGSGDDGASEAGGIVGFHGHLLALPAGIRVGGGEARGWEGVPVRIGFHSCAHIQAKAYMGAKLSLYEGQVKPEGRTVAQVRREERRLPDLTADGKWTAAVGVKADMGWGQAHLQSEDDGSKSQQNIGMDLHDEWLSEKVGRAIITRQGGLGRLEG